MVSYRQERIQKRGVMMQPQLPSKQQQMLPRPRVDALIRDGLRQPVLVILAGPGYGKTQAMADYVSQGDVTALWLRLSVLDNLTNHFWDHLLKTLAQEYAQLTGRLEALAFPETVPDMDVFIRLIAEVLSSEKETVWVFDDYGEITNQQVKDFVNMLVDANVEGLRLVLISNVMDSTESIAYMTRSRSLLQAEDLRFTRDEIAALYQMHGVILEPDEVNMVERYTEGWSMPLLMLVLEHDRLPDLVHSGGSLTNHIIVHLFEERFFSRYPRRQQKLIVKLSLLNSFTKAFAISLYDGDAVELEALGNHAFLMQEPTSGAYFFHYLYRLFLQEKRYLLNVEELQAIWRKAAVYSMASGDITEAVACYRKAEDYIGMMEAVSQYIYSQSEMTAATANYFLEHIALLSSEQLKGYPRADYMRAYVYMILVRLEEAEALLLDLEVRLLEDSHEDRYDLLCDVYATMGLIHMMQNVETFADDFRKSAECADHLPPEVLAKKSGLMRMHNGNAFSMADNKPGAKERMERVVHEAAPYMAKIWSGDISGIEYMFSAEAAYLSYHMDEAKKNAYQCLYKAEAHAQHDLVCNAYRLLARIAHMRGDYTGMKEQLMNAVEYAERHDNSVMRKIRDNALGWYYNKVRDHTKIPKSILELSRAETHNLAYGRPQVTYANYLHDTGEYARMVGMMRYAERGLYLARGIWQERIIRLLMLSVGYYNLNDTETSMEMLWAAYDMCYDNGLVTLFIEAGDAIVNVIQLAREQDTYAFSAEWLDFIQREAAAFAKRADRVRAAYRKEHPVKINKENPLSKREQEVLTAIAKGLTREEIAVEQYISINTVKSTIRKIYNKLDASNKADAVSIAITRRYIEA